MLSDDVFLCVRGQLKIESEKKVVRNQCLKDQFRYAELVGFSIDKLQIDIEFKGG